MQRKYWIIELNGAEKKLPADVVASLKSMGSLGPEAKADALFSNIENTLVAMGKNETQGNMIRTCMSRINQLVRRLCKDVVCEQEENAFLSHPYVQKVASILDRNLFTYEFRQSAAKKEPVAA